MRILSNSDVLAECAKAFGLSDDQDVSSIFRPALRRAAFLLAPCSMPELARFVAEPLSSFGDQREKVEQVIQEMIAYGDILEMKRISSDPWDAPAYVLRPAPPAFVVRSPDEVILLGVAGELASPLPAELAAQVTNEGPVRVLRADPSERLVEHLKLLGLAELSEHAWLRTPPISRPADYVSAWHARLMAVLASPAAIDGLEILDPHRPSTFYSGRWRPPAPTDNGVFVARRDQAYGAKLWSLVEISAGQTQRVLDLVSPDDTQRPCDIAWRIQAALDTIAGNPQIVSVECSTSRVSLGFNSPIPAFAERRLSIVGAKVRCPGTLFRFEIPVARADAELAALNSSLWMEAIESGAMQ
jgi:hypothetical protein